MAELVVNSQCKSLLRQSTNAFLTVTFPLWGIASPIFMACMVMGMVSYIQSTNTEKIAELLGFATLAMVYSISSLLLKRALVHDLISVDKQGIKLPLLIGSSINMFNRFIPWSNVSSIQATVAADRKHSRLNIVKKKGGKLVLPIEQLHPDFVEQFLLATQAWAPAARHESITELQDLLRIGASKSSEASYTELWEEELGRRFSPTNYVPLEAGKVLRNSTLKVVSQLSSGGLSALYMCQLDGKQLVVLKEAVIPEQGSESIRDKARELFEREAKLLMKLDNPGIVHVLDSFCEGERNYLLLEFINGIDLRQLVAQNGAQKEADVLEWAVQIAVALKHMHEREQPIIHRDLTPDNIVMRNDGQAIIVDFGAANEFIGTATGTFVGKHAYIAPEQLRGKASTSSDIYAFGCTLYYLLTGAEPEALLPSNPKELAPSTSDELCELIESCTQLESSDRYQSVAQMLPVLRRLAAQSLVA